MSHYLSPSKLFAKTAFPNDPPVDRCPSCGWDAETEYNPETDAPEGVPTCRECGYDLTDPD